MRARGRGVVSQGEHPARALAEATEQVQRLRDELHNDPAASSARERAAQERAARERQQALDRALAELPKVQACHYERSQRKGGRAKAAKRKGSEAVREARRSTTDPEARVTMKMGDEAFALVGTCSSRRRQRIGDRRRGGDQRGHRRGPDGSDDRADRAARPGQRPTEYSWMATRS
ncbi:MAG: hypothetical protein U0325_16275 [Polyangiales bacterium]